MSIPEQYIHQYCSEEDQYNSLRILTQNYSGYLLLGNFQQIPYTVPLFFSFQEVCQVVRSPGKTSIVLRENPDKEELLSKQNLFFV